MEFPWFHLPYGGISFFEGTWKGHQQETPRSLKTPRSRGYGYGLVILIRNFLLALVPVLLVPLPFLQVLVVGLVLLASLVIQVRFWPWRKPHIVVVVFSPGPFSPFWTGFRRTLRPQLGSAVGLSLPKSLAVVVKTVQRDPMLVGEFTTRSTGSKNVGIR